MPGRRTTEIPSTILRSDKHAQELWKKAHDNAEKTYGGRGGSARRVAFAALKHEYKKEGDRWVKKKHKGPSDPQAARGPATKKKSTDRDAAPTAGGKVAKNAKQARSKAKEAARERSQSRRKAASKTTKKAA